MASTADKSAEVQSGPLLRGLKSLVRTIMPQSLRKRAHRFLEATLQPTVDSVPAMLHRSSAWRRGYGKAYEAYKPRFCAAALRDERLLEELRTSGNLPPRYGIGMDERCVEWPWTVAHLAPIRGRLLDAGSTLNHLFVLESPPVADKELTIFTLAPESGAFWSRGISYVYGDLRCTGLRDAWYDAVACISTLEHVGMDNTGFTGHAEHRERRTEDFLLAVQEMSRVLRPGGTALLTVPFGAGRIHRDQRVFDAATLEQAIEAFCPARRQATFYRYDANGWSRSSAPECADREYVEWITRPRSRWPVPIPVEADYAICARAVACVRLEKRRTP